MEVLHRDQAVAFGHLCDDQLGGLAAIKLVGSGLGDAPQGCCEFGLQKQALRADIAEVVSEIRAALESLVVITDIVDENLGRVEAPFSQLCRGQDEVAPWQLAVVLMGFPHSCDRAGYSRSLAANQG